MVPAGGNGNRHRPRGSRAPPRPHRGPAGCYRRRKTGRPRITSPWTCAPHRTGNPRVFELHSPLSAEEFRSLRSKRCSAYARRQTATGQTTGRMRTPKHGGRRRRLAKAGRATTRHDGGPGANPALHKVPNTHNRALRGANFSTPALPSTGGGQFHDRQSRKLSLVTFGRVELQETTELRNRKESYSLNDLFRFAKWSQPFRVTA